MTQKVYRLINASLSSGNGSTSKVKITSVDNTENYLNLKIAVQDGLTKEITNPAANEVLTLGLDASQIDHTLLSNIGTNSHAEIDSALNLITDVNWTGDYNNGTTYTVGDGVMFNGASFRMIASIGAAGYDPVTYPANWLQVTDYVSPNDIGLGNVDNTSDADKPISDDTQDALDLKVAKAGDTMTGDLEFATNSYAIYTISDVSDPSLVSGDVVEIYRYQLIQTENIIAFSQTLIGTTTVNGSGVIPAGPSTSSSIASVITQYLAAENAFFKYDEANFELTYDRGPAFFHNAGLPSFFFNIKVPTRNFEYLNAVEYVIQNQGNSLVLGNPVKIANLTDGVHRYDAVNKQQLDNIDNLKLSKTGDSMTGVLNIGTPIQIFYSGTSSSVAPSATVDMYLTDLSNTYPDIFLGTVTADINGDVPSQESLSVLKSYLDSNNIKYKMDDQSLGTGQLGITYEQDYIPESRYYVPKIDGAVVPYTLIPASYHQIKRLADGVRPNDAVNKSQLDSKVSKAGDTITGNIVANVFEDFGGGSTQTDYAKFGPTAVSSTQIGTEFKSTYVEPGYDSEVTTYVSPSGVVVSNKNTDLDAEFSHTPGDPGRPVQSLIVTDSGFKWQNYYNSTTTAVLPTSNVDLTTKQYVDTTINTNITTLSNELKIPQAIYVNNNPTATGYVATGSIQKPYQTIKAALDSIVDASAAKRYCIVIAPGTYNELNTIRLKGFVDLISIANDTVVINAGGSRLLWSNTSPGRVFITDIAISHGVEVLNDDPTGTSGCVLDLDNVDTGTVIFNGRGGGRDFIQLRNDTRLSGSCTINSAATTIFDSTIIGNVNLTDIGCVAPDSFGSAITATLRSNYQLNVNITSVTYDIYVDAWGNNNVSTLTMTSNSAIPSTFNSDAISYPNTITLSGSPAPVVARTTQARAVSVNPVSGIVSTDVQSALEELKNQITSIDLSVSSEPTGFLDASQTTISFSDSTPDRTFTIAPVSSSFIFYANGEMFTKTTAQVVQIPNNEGNHYIYFDTDGVLKSTQVFDDSIILTKAFVSVVYWDVDNQKHIYFANERHGLIMDGQTHIHFHTVFGAQYISGLALQNFTIGVGDANADAQYTADEGIIRDEDLKIIIPPQTQIPTLYRLGAAGNWRRKEVDSFPFIYSGTEGYVGGDGRLPFNEFTGGAWQLSEIANNGFVLIHYFATNDIEYPIIAIQGQAQYSTIVDARISANSEISQLSGLPFAEFVAIGSVILQSSDGYTNTVKARVRLTDTGSNYVDFRGTQILVAAATANDHGLLSGLDSDDHIQYHTDSRADTWLGDKTTDDLAQGTNNLYLDIPSLATPSALDAANDDLVIYSSLDTAHKKIKLNQLTSVVGSAGDIAETSASFLNNVSIPQPVDELAFDTAVVSSFEAQVVVSRGTKKEVFTLLGVQIDGDFSMSVESVGVDTGIDFTITDLGQVEYTSTDAIDGGTIKFRAITLTV